MEKEVVDYQKIIRSKYRKLLRLAEKRGGDKEDLSLIRKAYKVSADAHKGVFRKSGEPYITHPLEVALIVSEEIGLGPKSIAAALLHDVVEDSEYTNDQISHMFGESIAYIVSGLTKIQGIFDNQSSSMQVENFRKLLLSISDDVRVILIKMADRLHNMRTLEDVHYAKQLKTASETLYIFAPLAHRMGLYYIKSEFEDLGLKYTEQDVYKEIAEKLDDFEQNDSDYLKRFSSDIYSLLSSEAFDFSIKTRTKGIFSIRRKMINQGISFEEVYDKYALRILLDAGPKREKGEIWRAYSIITSVFKANPRRLRDWITSPKANGYESLHITVMGPEGHWIEIQIRSNRMDLEAERGYAAHWRYKEDDSGNTALDEWLSTIRENIENQEGNALDFVDKFKLQLFSEEIFAFTPQGKMLTLPKHSTPIDFAFEIHTDLGMKILGAKANGKLVPLSYELQSGDQIQILSSDSQTPNEQWINWAVTPKARTTIRHFIKNEEKKSVDRGERLLRRVMKKAKFDWNQSRVQRMLNHFGINAPSDLYSRFGSGKYHGEHIRNFIQEESGSFYQYLRKRFKPKPSKLRDVSIDSGRIVFGPDSVILDHDMSECCRPIQNDPIFGFIEDDGIKVHRTDCPEAINLQGRFAEKVIVAQWAKNASGDFNATLKFSGVDSSGLLLKVSQVISNEMNMDIISLHINGSEGVFSGTISVSVLDRRQLSQLATNLRSIKGIDIVEREVNKVK
jgi:GTP pyrophosphokinase|tara:strand:- start:2224 stop:4428 length:2205 start_codon:yes stop_codon:yes gene_type:complete